MSAVVLLASLTALPLTGSLPESSLVPAPAPILETVIVSGAQEVSPFQGTWILNVQESDNVMEQMQRARRARGFTQEQQLTEAQMQEMMEVAQRHSMAQESMILDVRDGWISFNIPGGGIAMFPGNNEETRANIGGTMFEVRAKAEDDRLEIRRDWERIRIVDEFTLDDDGRRMKLKRQVRGAPMGDYTVDYVYDRQS
jgi:hypothetical protein